MACGATTAGEEVAGIYNTVEMLDSLSVQGSQVRDIIGIALSTRGTGTMTIIGNILDTWVSGSNDSKGRTVQLDFFSHAASKLAFSENRLLPSSRAMLTIILVHFLGK